MGHLDTWDSLYTKNVPLYELVHLYTRTLSYTPNINCSVVQVFTIRTGEQSNTWLNFITMDNTQRVYRMSFASVYPLYIQKAEKKGRTKEEVDTIIYWLTGYDAKTLQQQIDNKTDFENFFAQAPAFNPHAPKITGVICGHRVEDIADPVMQKVRYLDKLIDELAKGKAMEKILRI